MKKIDVEVEKSTQRGRVGVEETLAIKPHRKGPGGDDGGKPKPKTLRQIVEEGFAESRKRFEQIEDRLDRNNIK